MAFLSGDVRKENAVFLLVLAPIVLRLWYEAVVWRLEQGPQMLGFQVLHLAAGGALAPVLAPIFLISFLAVYAYLLWVIVVVILRFVPKAQRGLSNVHLAVAGALSYLAFGYIAGFLQREDLPREALLAGSFLLTLLVLVAAWLVYSGFRRKAHDANVAV